jgi:NitT/TauT family transport system substrate-binding protein
MLSIVLAACGSTSSAKSQSADRTISIGIPGGAGISQTPYLVAEGTGGFTKRGITVNEQNFATGSDALAALLGGSVDVSVIGGLDLLRSAEKKTGVVAFFSPFLSAAGAVIGAKKYQTQHGTDLKSYAHSQWGYAKEGTNAMLYLKTAAQASGLQWDSLNHAALGSQPAMLAAMKAGRVDIVSMDATTAATAIQEGIGYLVLNTSDPRQTANLWGRQAGAVFATTTGFAKDHPQLLQDLVTALVEGMLRVQDSNEDPAAVYKALPADKQAAYKSSWTGQWAILSPSFAGDDGSLPDGVLQATIDWATRSGAMTVSALPDTSVYVDNSYVARAYAALGRKPSS